MKQKIFFFICKNHLFKCLFKKFKKIVPNINIALTLLYMTYKTPRHKLFITTQSISRICCKLISTDFQFNLFIFKNK